ncbi:MAG TPA: carboxypeptidase-like regulatory domain-containing protein [Bacteroidales bacterium]|nr:carboxypeptidase-like regulatory domain-containing protein [Bacteroidales bacterium]
MLKCRIKKSIWTVSLMFFILFSFTKVVSAENNEKTQQTQTVQGKVSDVSGNPLTGVNVIVKGTLTGSITDIDGKFSINVSGQGAALLFSFIGYLDNEIIISNQEFLNVTLLEDVLALDEVVVVGYGTQRKRDMTGSVGTVSAKKLKDNAVSGIGQVLQGKLAGVQVTQTSVLTN